MLCEFYLKKLKQRRNNVLIHAAIWMNLKNNILSERNQIQKVTYRMIPFILNIQNR